MIKKNIFMLTTAILVLCFVYYLNTYIDKLKLSNTVIIDSYEPILTTKEIESKLFDAFKSQNNIKLEEIFEEWNKRIKPNSQDFTYQNDTIYSIYNIFETFYRPKDLLELGTWEWGNNLNSNNKFIAVQNSVLYSVVNAEDFDEYKWQGRNWIDIWKDTIINFRPPVNISSNKVLYLTKEYSNAIRNFLDTNSTQMGDGNIMNPSSPVEGSKLKYNFLLPMIRVLHGHWDGWHVETHPYVQVVIFNKSMTKARVDFRTGYQGGEAFFERFGFEWIMVESKTTWIE